MAIADSCDLPIVLYNIPGRSAVAISAVTFERLAAHPNIRAVKEATGSLDSAGDIVGRTNLTLLSGDDSLTLPMAALGATDYVALPLGLASPSAMFVPLNDTTISGTGVVVTAPLISKLNGFSLSSSLVKLICPFLTPVLDASSRTVKVSKLPAVIVGDRGSTTVNPGGS